MLQLRSKTVDQQVGTVTALNFCLALRPPLLKLTPELINFLQEALQIAESDETVWVVKFMNPRVATSLNKLRTACIELLCTAMAWADFKTQNHSELRAKIISMFFKSLTSRTPEIVTVAKDGLRQFHYGVFFAYMRLREQEIRNLMWIFECVAQNQKSRVHDSVVFVF
ncbi:Phosphatidylinositol 3- and 4-kinase family protein with FAT domain [Abeliophyllum distichum]|uniref:Phosphatidylinositol 3- and 4-kinase family protein with FAT domain n=1 Tax=Abeliophyllum distichum TaxID=126358 RepID=A0ABD1RSN7_9LAMI